MMRNEHTITNRVNNRKVHIIFEDGKEIDRICTYKELKEDMHYGFLCPVTVTSKYCQSIAVFNQQKALCRIGSNL